MTDKKFKTIGLIAEDINTDYTRDIIHSIQNAIPQDDNVRVFTLAGKLEDTYDTDPERTGYVKIYNSVVFLTRVIKFDALIIALGSLRNMETERLNDFLSVVGNVPKVFISSDYTDGVVIRYDNESGIREVVDLLVNIGNLSHFAMLGGREDNYDAVERRQIYKRCLMDRGIELPDRAYVSTDMSVHCHERAAKLLDDNPEVQAIFCVNDSVAKPLYDVMQSRGLVPGRDIKVFGFDNTRMAAGMEPPLSSIGPSEMTMGKLALEIVLKLIDGEKVESATVMTKLYARSSLEYEMLDRTTLDVLKMDRDDIDVIFDMCFYRYKNEIYKRDNVNIKRLFNEIIYRVLTAVKNRYMSEDEFYEVSRLIDIFIDNGAMDYTDPQRFVKSINQLQAAINMAHKTVAVYINRLFLHIKDRMILILAAQKENAARRSARDSERMKKYLMSGFNRMETVDDPTDISIRMMERLGVKNLLFYMFEKPYTYGDVEHFPENIDLRCLIKDGEMYVLSHDRRSGPVSDMFSREEIPSKCRCYIGFPVFCQGQIFGLLTCEVARDVYSMGELIAAELGRTLFVNNKNVNTEE